MSIILPIVMAACVALLGGCARGRGVDIAAPAEPTHPAPDPARGSPRSSVVFHRTFDAPTPQASREVSLNGKTAYTVEKLDGSGVLRAESQSSASILIYAVNANPDTASWLRWRWRVERFPRDEDLTAKAGSDAAARVYVYFDTPGFPWQKRSLSYVWSSHLPMGTILTSPFSAQTKLIVVTTAGAPGQWQTVERNLEDDYRRCFNEDPPNVAAIGVMSDSDNTRSDTLAYFDELELRRERR